MEIITYHYSKLLIPIFVTLVILFGLGGESYADQKNTGIYSNTESPFGVPYKVWIAKWWQWIFSIPPEDNPKLSYAPQKCLENQVGPVWFLPDLLTGVEDRECTVPKGKAILVPIQTGIGWNNLKVENLISDDDIKSIATEAQDASIISASLDGRELKDLKDYRTLSDFFNLTIPVHNFLNESSGNNIRAIVDGYFVFLEPLKEGNHVLSLKTTVIQTGEQGVLNQASENIYHITVK